MFYLAKDFFMVSEIINRIMEMNSFVDVLKTHMCHDGAFVLACQGIQEKILIKKFLEGNFDFRKKITIFSRKIL